MQPPASDAFSAWLARWETLLEEGAGIPLPPPAARGKQESSAPASATARSRCLILSPHPDDEAIHAGLPLRLAREANWDVVNLAVTFGSNTARRAERLRELEAACAVLDFTLVRLDPTDRLGLEGVTPHARQTKPVHWRRHVERLAASLEAWAPELVLTPHAADAHPTHAGCHWLLWDAIDLLISGGHTPPAWVALTEYWAPLATPNLLVGLDRRTVATMLAALAQHRGEVARNPYHLMLPAWLIDNVRRGSERVMGPGSSAASQRFGVLLELFSVTANGWTRWTPEAGSGAVIDARASLSTQPLAPLFNRLNRPC
ncbi:MAG: PIG-L deacetylase family protein [Casimicrobiaceae bacterium]